MLRVMPRSRFRIPRVALGNHQVRFLFVLPFVLSVTNSLVAVAQEASTARRNAADDQTSFRNDAREVNPPTKSQVPVALVGGLLVDGRGGEPVKDACLIVRDGVIEAVGRKADTTIPSDIDVIDLKGKTILPGFVDCHFHSINDLNPPRTFLRKGVTSLRDPGHPFRFYQAVEQADELMPRVFLCGGHLDAYPPIWPDQAVIIDSEDRGRKAVAEHVANGATAIKIYFRLPLEYYSSICTEADENSIPVTAHLELVKATDAIAAGVDGIEHITSFGTSMSEADEVENFVSTVRANPGRRNKLRYRLWSRINWQGNPLVDPMLDQIVSSRVFVSPTLAVFERRSDFDNVEDFEVTGFARMLEFLSKCHQAGATIVVGSHTWVPGAKFGWAFHREMELLVECGMSPSEVLTAATWHGARFLGAQSRIGSLEVGKQADLLIVDGDPTQDIKAARNVDRVMLAGEWVNRDN